MTKMIVDISTKYDKLLGRLKVDKEYSSKAEVVEKIVETFFKKNIDLD